MSKLNITRIEELELPRQIDVSFINKNFNYETGVQSAERETCSSIKDVAISLPIVMDDYKAKRIAELALYANWSERLEYNFNLSAKYSYLEPADVISVTVDGTSHKIRIQEIKFNENGTLDVAGVYNDSLIYEGISDDGSGNEDTSDSVVVSPLCNSILDIIELPALTNDDLEQAKVYFSIKGEEENWRGSKIYESSDDGDSYNSLFETKLRTTTGTAYNELGTANPFYFDNTNTLTIELDENLPEDTALESLSEIAVLGGKNIALVGDEIIQYKTATLQEDGGYILSGLLRGLLGTEGEINNHSIGERFVLLNENLLSQSIENQEISTTKKYKAATFGQDISDATATDLTITAQNLKPLSPVWIEGARDSSGNLTITWKRRARGNHNWRDGVEIPLLEAYEKYDIEIGDGSGGGFGMAIREELGLTSASYTYSVTDQTTDFGSAQSAVNVRIYQVSDAVGRGGCAEVSV